MKFPYLVYNTRNGSILMIVRYSDGWYYGYDMTHPFYDHAKKQAWHLQEYNKYVVALDSGYV